MAFDLGHQINRDAVCSHKDMREWVIQQAGWCLMDMNRTKKRRCAIPWRLFQEQGERPFVAWLF